MVIGHRDNDLSAGIWVVTIQWPKPNAKAINNPTVIAIVTIFAVKLSWTYTHSFSIYLICF